MSQKIYTDLDIKGNTTIGSIANATTDTDKFLVSDNGLVKYRTGAEMLSDLGVAPGAASNVQHQVKAEVAINKGQAVYVTSADGTNMIVGLASNTSEATSSKTMGLLDSTVAINGFANVITEGLLAGLNTIGATAGDPVWLGTDGNLIYGLINKPYAPAHLVFIGIVTRVNASNGEIFVKVQNGFELNEIHDVDLKTTTPVNGDILGFNGTLWVNKTIAAWLGYTPANASGTTNYVSKFTGSGTLGNSQIFDNGTNVGIRNTNPRSLFHITSFTDTGYPILGQQKGTFFLSGDTNAYGLMVGIDSSSGTLWMQNQRTDTVTTAYNILFNPVGGNIGIGATTTPGARLDVRAQGALSTDIAFRVRNSADTINLIQVNGDGTLNITSDGTNSFAFDYAGGSSIRINGDRVVQKSGDSTVFGGTQNNLSLRTNSVNRLTIDINGLVSINGSVITSAQLSVDSTTRGFLPPRMSTTQRDAIVSPAAGLIVYDKTENKHYGYNGTSWNAFESVDNKVTDLNTPNNTTYPTTQAVVNENKKATITVELIDLLTTNFYAPNALRINSTALISGSGTITLKVNDVAYTLGNLIIQGAKITVETTTASVYNLIGIYE